MPESAQESPPEKISEAAADKQLADEPENAEQEEEPDFALQQHPQIEDK